MNRCEKCGHWNANESFCTRCGNRLTESVNSVSASRLKGNMNAQDNTSQSSSFRFKGSLSQNNQRGKDFDSGYSHIQQSSSIPEENTYSRVRITHQSNYQAKLPPQDTCATKKQNHSLQIALVTAVAVLAVVLSAIIFHTSNAKNSNIVQEPILNPTSTNPSMVSPSTVPSVTAPSTTVPPAESPTIPPTTLPPAESKEHFYMQAGTLTSSGDNLWQKLPVWGQTQYKREDVVNVIFYDSIPENIRNPWDVSQSQNGTVLAWMESNTLCIAANGYVTLNPDASGLFAGFVNLQTLDFNDSVDTSAVTSMRRMFSACNNLRSVDFSSFNTSRVSDMSHMFASCESLTSLDLSSFDTSKVEDMESMFYGCKRLTSLNVRSFDTSNVRNMIKMFAYCSSLTEINVTGFDTSQVQDMSHMFRCCTVLQSVDISNFNTASLERINCMFYKCKGLTSINMYNFFTPKVYGLCHVFEGSGIRSLEVAPWNISRNAKYTNFMDYGSMINGSIWGDFLDSLPR